MDPTPEQLAICEEISTGSGVRKACEAIGYPERRFFIDLANSPTLQQFYARARDVRVEAMAEEMLQISDESRVGEKIEKKEIGRECSLCGRTVKWQSRGWFHGLSDPICEGAEAAKVIEEKIVFGDMIERSRLQVDARKWLISKWAPRKYGDRIELAGSVDTSKGWADILRERRAKRSKSVLKTEQDSPV
jgi:hypothetical protein